MTRSELISEIEMHAARRGIAPATVTSRAVGNSRLYSRLKNGGDCTLDVAAAVVAFIESDNTAPPKACEAAE